VNAGPDIDAANNDFRRIQNALNAATSGDTIMLSGTFDFTQPFAAAAWALGNDDTASTNDDYEVLVPPGLSNVTLTASSLGAATIQGPSDLAAVNLEAFLVFDSSLSGASQGWTISNLQIQDFDLSIGMFAVADSDYNNTKITNNHIRIPKDLNATVAPADVNQNIGINFSFGTNQTISGNMIDFAGDGVSDSANSNFSTEVGMQSNTRGGNTYDGLQITNNILRVLNAQSADPEVILGIWENGHSHTSNITVSGNQFINMPTMGNNPATNLQRAFRVTSHSSATTTVKYQNNTEEGANIGFQWISGADFTGNQPVQLISNNILNNFKGVLIQSNGLATLSFNRIVGNTNFALDNETSNPINAENNWWGCNFGPGLGGAGCAGTANGVMCTTADSPTEGGKNGDITIGSCLVDFNPWLVLRLTAVPNTVIVGGNSALTADLTFNSDNVDTHLSGNIPDLTPVAFAGVDGTVAPSSTSTTSGKANSTFTGTSVGAGSASTTVDMQTVSTPITVNPAPCTITCPANQTQQNDPNQCGAVVTYPAPTTVGTCGTVVCSPASGSFFPVGTTTVTCKSNNNAGPESCTFTVTVNDTQLPIITCPGSVNSTATASCPIATGALANFTVTASDNCPGVTVVCIPPSGSTFPVGTTSVTCTATDASGNKASCSFTVSAFSFCLQDDSDPGNVVLVNAQTGDFSFCCGGVPIASGRGDLTIHGCIGNIDSGKGNRQVHIQWDTAAVNGLGAGTAFVRKLSDKLVCQISDKNMSNNTCQCSNPPPSGNPRKPPAQRTF
jgi:hypothetical protein